MIVKELSKTKNYEDDIREILNETDDEFYPPLSQRTGTKQSDFNEGSEKTIENYHQNLINQRVLVCLKNSNLCGILSFTEDGKSSININDELYLSTIVVSPSYRGEGISKLLIKKIKDIAREKNKDIYTRTWSTNTASMRMFKSQNFEEYKFIENDRDEGIHTIYYYWTR